MVAPHPVATRLDTKGIRRVYVVDDAFDAPRRGDFTRNELAEFWNELDLDSAEQREMLEETLGSVPKSEEEIDDASVAALYKQRDNLGPLMPAFERHLKVPLSEKHNHLDPLVDELTTLGLDVNCLGTAGSVDPGEVQLIFLDYYLGASRDGASVERARAVVGDLLSAYPVGSEKPLVVLMSSDDDVKTVAEQFRRQTNIVGGMFYFLPKSDLTDRVRLLLDLDMLAMALPDGHVVQKFIDTIDDKINAIVPEFLADVKRLNLDDYVYIQRLSLQADGHPLGDYLLWLYSAYFGHLLFERALGTERRELDGVTFNEWIPSQFVPSSQLTAMYNAALFDMTVGPLGPHPRLPRLDEEEVPGQEVQGAASPEQVEELAVAQDDGGKAVADGLLGQKPGDETVKEAQALPYFNMGDIFVSPKTHELLMVCNPACDLEFTPDDKRVPNPEDSILFIPGTLEGLDQPSGSPTLRTELFQFDGDSFRILWQPRRVRAIAYRVVDGWLSERGFARIARLRMPFSLEIQQYFASHLTRVGVPVPPPFYRPLQVTVYKRGSDGTHEELTFAKSESDAFLVTTRSGEDKCVIIPRLVRALQNIVAEIGRQELLAVDGALEEQEGKRRKRVNRRIRKARKSASDFIAWREVAELFTLPSNGATKQFDQAGIMVSNTSSIGGPWTSDALLMVHVAESHPPLEPQPDVES